jgi:type III secretion system (T3SS) inner membrane Yop/YscD-like protein
MAAPILRFDRYSSPEPHILPLAPRITLEITRGRVQQRIRPIRGRVFLIGTASDCDLVLGDLAFPDAYAYLFVQDSKIAIRRLGSGPELIVSGEIVEAAEVQHGDCISFGPFELRVVVEDRADPIRTSPDGSSLIHSIY